jgi:hypothetical protein
MANSWSHHLGFSRPRTWPLSSACIGSALPLPIDRLGILWPAFWLVVGLSASFAYRHAANFTPMTSAGLPHPLFPTQAVILSVLLTTSARHWWLFLVAYYAALVSEGIAWSSLPTWYLLVSNVANAIEPLVGVLLLRHFYRFLRDSPICTRLACSLPASRWPPPSAPPGAQRPGQWRAIRSCLRCEDGFSAMSWRACC